MPETLGFRATILRPACFIDNEVMIADVVRRHNVYPMPIGSKGMAMVDARDIAEIAAIERIRHDVAAIWTEVLGRPIVYRGDDLGGFEASMANFMQVWMRYEMRIMTERYISDGMIPQEGDHERLVKLPGRDLHSYRETALALAG